jgi:uncharacterized protein YllA (UPF0747 family)
MPHIHATIDQGALEADNRIFCDYVSSPSRGLPPYLSGFSSDPSFWEKKRNAVKQAAHRTGTAWADVIGDLKRYNNHLGANQSIIRKIESSTSNDVCFIVTGQQPGMFGGPLLTFYKVATAVALASVLEKRMGLNCVPLYWCGADDTDFQEIHRITMITHDWSIVNASLPREAHEGGMPVGDIGLPWIKRTWDGLIPFIDAFASSGYVKSILGSALKDAEDHGTLVATLLMRLFGGNMAAVDGRSEIVREYAHSVFLEYVENEARFKSEVAARGVELEKGGYHAQLSMGTDSGVFLLEDGRRKSVAPDRRARLLETVKRSAASCSPGVVLRNLVQDFTFAPLAVVLGPAELAYRAQISGLYPAFQIEPPVVIPRLAGTIIPQAFSEVFADVKDDALALLQNPSAFRKDVYKRSLQPQIRDASERFRSAISRAVADFSKQVGDHLPERGRSRVESKLSEIRNRAEATANSLVEAGKANALDQWPFLGELDHWIRPDGKPQDRTIAGLTPYLFAGEKMGNALMAVAAAYVDDLLDGNGNHIVYSI